MVRVYRGDQEKSRPQPDHFHILARKLHRCPQNHQDLRWTPRRISGGDIGEVPPTTSKVTRVEFWPGDHRTWAVTDIRAVLWSPSQNIGASFQQMHGMDFWGISGNGFFSPSICLSESFNHCWQRMRTRHRWKEVSHAQISLTEHSNPLTQL